jgi:hypothetical protein
MDPTKLLKRGLPGVKIAAAVDLIRRAVVVGEGYPVAQWPEIGRAWRFHLDGKAN